MACPQLTPLSQSNPYRKEMVIEEPKKAEYEPEFKIKTSNPNWEEFATKRRWWEIWK